MKQNWVENVDFYFNEAGLLVQTESGLLKRGYCCGYGCLHCPYQYVQVPEPRKTELLQHKAQHAKNTGHE